MPIPRRLLPSTALLHAFEAVARTGSVSIAARELNLTQSAVSRQIKALEEQLEVELFARERQTLRLTLAGAAYAREIREALRRISIAALNIRANPRGGSLNLAVPATFAARWLAPRLPDFGTVSPEVMINVVTRQEPPDLASETIDAAVQFGRGPWPGAASLPICGESVVPVCTPALARRFKFRKPADVLKAPVLILVSRPDAWERWLEANGAAPAGVHGMMFDQFETIIQAAIAGAGLGLVPRLFVDEEIARRRLVIAVNRPTQGPDGYHLTWLSERSEYPPLQAFRRWLTAVAA